MSNSQNDLSIIGDLKNAYPTFAGPIDDAVQLASTDLLVGTFGENGEPIYFDFKDIINKSYLLGSMATMCIVLEEEEYLDYCYAIELFLQELNLSEEENHIIYGRSLNKPSAMLLLSLIDRKLRLLGQQYSLDSGMKKMIDKAFKIVVDRNVNSNAEMTISRIKLIAYTYVKIYNMYGTNDFVPMSVNTIDRNCIMHDIVNNNGKYDVAHVNKKDVPFLIYILFAVCVITETDGDKIKSIRDFIIRL